MRKLVIILYGPPGSGKSTQANLLARELDIIHFDTGQFFESILYDPKRSKEKAVKIARKQFENGILVTPSFVLREVSRALKRIDKAEWGVAFSGSPRTLYEAKGLAPLLERLYGRKNVFTFILKVPARLSIRRNGNRLVCRYCASPLLTEFYPAARPKHCQVCGGALYRRTIDSPEKIKTRLREYETRTKPIFKFMKTRGFVVREIDGRPAPYAVFKKIYAVIKSRSRD